jgi:uncharacterized membrane protein
MAQTRINVGQTERIISGVFGGVWLLQSLGHRGLLEKVLAGTLLYRGISGHSYVYQWLNMNTADGSSGTGETEVERKITIEKPIEEVYQFWKMPENFAQVMSNFAQVSQSSDGHVHWKMNGPTRQSIEWDTQVVEDVENEVIRWQTLGESKASNGGEVHFRPASGDRGTEVTLRLSFNAPGGAIGGGISKVLNLIPRTIEEKSLRRFKSLIETGEIPTLAHNLAARATADTW